MRWTLLGLLLVTGCGDLNRVGRAPEFSPMQASYEQDSMYTTLPRAADDRGPTDHSSLWTSQRSSLLGDHRARLRGDILTVVVEINDQAQFSDTTGRTRKGTETLGAPSLFGIPERLGAGTGDLISTDSSSTFNGTGAIARNEKVTLRLAVTVVEELPNGVLKIEGQQEVRLNAEMRVLTISGYVRPDDISRQNEVTYDKIAQAQISYGAEGSSAMRSSRAMGNSLSISLRRSDR